MNRGSLLTSALLCCIVLAGCGGTNAPVTETETATVNETAVPTVTETTETEVSTSTATRERNDTSGDAVVVSGGTLPFDANVTYQRVQSIVGIEGDEPPVVVVRDAEDVGPGAGLDEFSGALGITGNTSFDGVAGRASENRIDLYIGPNHTAAEIEQTLAHEFAHVVLGVPGPTNNPNYPPTSDTRLASRSIREGAATYVATNYSDRHLPGVANETVLVRRHYERGSPVAKLNAAQYYYGARYLDERLDSPRNLSAVYDEPPMSTEQVLHGDARDEDRPPVPNVRSSVTSVGDTRGELFTRVALGTELNGSVAASAAVGWDGDTLVTYEPYGESGSYVWTLFWENETEADEFEAAVEQYVDRRTADPDAPAFRVDRTSTEAVTLLVGDESFVENTSVSVDEGTVDVDEAEGY